MMEDFEEEQYKKELANSGFYTEPSFVDKYFNIIFISMCAVGLIFIILIL